MQVYNQKTFPTEINIYTDHLCVFTDAIIQWYVQVVGPWCDSKGTNTHGVH